MTTTYLRPTGTITVGAVSGIKIASGRVTLDESKIPYGSAEIDVPLTADTALDSFDPRTNVRIVISASNGTTSRTFNMGLREREVDYGAKLVRLRLATDEALLLDYAALTRQSVAQPGYALRTIVSAVLAKIGATLASGTWNPSVAPAWALTNRVMNPVIDTTAGYTLATNSTSLGTGTTSPYVGSAYVRWNAVAIGNAFLKVDLADDRVVPGMPYTFGAQFRGSVVTTAQIRIHFEDARGATLAQTYSETVSIPVSPSWQAIGLTVWAPASAAKIIVYVLGNAQTAGIVYAMDAATLVDGENIIYFSGSTAADSLYTYAWDGSTDASASTRTPKVERAPESVQWAMGTTAWDFLEPLVASTGLRLFCDEARVWRLVKPSEYFVTGVVTVTPETASEGTDTITRDDAQVFSTGIAIRYSWEDEFGIPRVRTDVAGTPEKVLLIEVDEPYPGAGAAAAMLARRNGTGRIQDVSTLQTWTPKPGMEASLSLPGAPITRGRVVSIEWSFTNPSMRIGTNGLLDIPPGSWLAWTPQTQQWGQVSTSVTWGSLP